MSNKKVGLRAAGVATALAALALTTSMSGVASASPAKPGEALCHAGPGPAPVYRNGDFARIYTIPVNGAMRVHQFAKVNGQTWAYGHGNGKPDGWTPARNFNRCIA